MARVELSLPAPDVVLTNRVFWNERSAEHYGDIAALAASPGVALLRRVIIFNLTNFPRRFGIDVTDMLGVGGGAAGPLLSDAWEASTVALTFRVPTLADFVIPGPTNPNNALNDDTEPYTWDLTEAQSNAAYSGGVTQWLSDFHALTAAQQAGVTLILDDGVTPAPTITGLSNAISVERGDTATDPFTLTDVNTVNPVQTTNARIATGAITGTGANRTLTVTGVAEGMATLTVSVNGDGGTVIQTVAVTVTAPATPAPTIRNLGTSVTITEGGSLPDPFTVANATTVTVATSDSNVATGAITGAGNNRTLTITAVGAGTADLTITATGDGGTTMVTVTVTVTAVIREPTITALASAQTVAAGSAVMDPFTVANTSTVTAESDDTDIATVGLTGTGNARTLTITGVAAGSATVTVTAIGVGGTTTQDVDVTVTATLGFDAYRPTPGFETILLMLVQARANLPATGNSDFYNENSGVGSLLDTTNALFDDVLASDIQVNQVVRRGTNEGRIQIRGGTGNYSTYFDTDVARSGQFITQTAAGRLVMTGKDPNEYLYLGPGEAVFRPSDPADYGIIDDIVSNERFLIAFEIPLTVAATVTVTGLATAASVVDGEDVELSFTVDPSDATTAVASDDDTVATGAITGTGANRTLTVTGEAEGATTLTITATSGTVTGTATVAVTVTAQQPTITNLATAITLDAGDTAETDFDITDTTAVTVATSASGVATGAITGAGDTRTLTVTGVAAGAATLTLTATGAGGTAMASIAVTVSRVITGGTVHSGPGRLANGADVTDWMRQAWRIQGGTTTAPNVYFAFTPDSSGPHTITLASGGFEFIFRLFDSAGNSLRIVIVRSGVAVLTQTLDAGATYRANVITGGSIDLDNDDPPDNPTLTIAGGALRDVADDGTRTGTFANPWAMQPRTTQIVPTITGLPTTAEVVAGSPIGLDFNVRDAATVTVASDAPLTATAALSTVSGTRRLTITGIRAGIANVTVTATSAGGVSVTHRVVVTVTPVIDPTPAPVIFGVSADNLSGPVGSTGSDAFMVTDATTVTAASDNAAVVLAVVQHTGGENYALTVNRRATGTATVTITAVGPGGTTRQDVDVTVAAVVADAAEVRDLITVQSIRVNTTRFDDFRVTTDATVTVATSDSDIVTAAVASLPSTPGGFANYRITYTAVAAGSATVTVTANRESIDTDVAVAVTVTATTPVISGFGPSWAAGVGGVVTDRFTAESADTSVTIASDDTNVATVAVDNVSGDVYDATITAVATGTADITVTATGTGGTTRETGTITVTQAQAITWTEHQVRPGEQILATAQFVRVTVPFRSLDASQFARNAALQRIAVTTYRAGGGSRPGPGRGGPGGGGIIIVPPDDPSAPPNNI